MKLPCSVVRDLLPVYAEKMVEEETRELVEEHLAECAECRKGLEALREAPVEPVETAEPLKKLKKQIRKQRWKAVLAAVLGVTAILLAVFFHAGSASLLPWREGLVEAAGVETVTPGNRLGRSYIVLREGNENVAAPDAYTGEALILRTDGSFNATLCTTGQEDGKVTALIQAVGRNEQGANDGGGTGELVLYPVPDRVIYGYSEPQKLLWGEELSGGVQVMPRLAMNYYLLLAAAAAAVTGALWFLFRRRPAGRVFRQVFFAPAAYIIAHLMINGLQGAAYSIGRNLWFTLMTALALYGVITLLWQAWEQRQKETSAAD